MTAGGEHQLCVSAQCIDHRVCVDARLPEWIHHRHWPARGQQGRVFFGHALQRVGLPVLDFDDQQATARMQDDEIRMRIGRAYRHVVPAQVVVFELGFETLRQALLAAGHAAGATADAGDEDSHVGLPGYC